MTFNPEKESLRANFRDRKEGLSEEEYVTFSDRIVEQLKAIDVLVQADTVHSFWPDVKSREPDIRELIRFLKDSKTRIVLPVVNDFRRNRTQSPRLRHIRLDDTSRLKENRWGILEPEVGTDVPIHEIDVVIAPAIGADIYGNRLGHGFGFYDEFLADLNIPVLCPIFSCCVVNDLPNDESDIAVSMIITEHEVIDPAKT